MLGCQSLDIICSSKLTVFLKLRSRKTQCSFLGTDKVRGQISQHIFASNGGYCNIFPNFQNGVLWEKDLKDNKHNSLHLGKNMLRYLSLGIICSSELTILLELRSRKTVRFSEQTMSTDKYPSIFSHQMEAMVYIVNQNVKNMVGP